MQFSIDFMTFSKVNLEAVDDSVSKVLRSWTDKMLSWLKRIQVFKSLILPK